MDEKDGEPAGWQSRSKAWLATGRKYFDGLTREGKTKYEAFVHREDVQRILAEADRLRADVSAEGIRRYEAFQQRDDVKKTLAEARRLSDEYGVTDLAERLRGTANDTVDTLSGRKLLEQVQMALAQQRRYNDVLAAKLAEALTRIEALEKAADRERTR